MIYLDNAATSWPKPESVIHAIDETIKKHGGNPGRSGHKMSIEAGRIILQTRELLCKLFNVQNPSQFIFCLNTTDALNLAIKGCLNEGDHVITTTLEHNSVLRPLKTLENQGKIKVTILKPGPDGYTTAEQVEKSIISKTKLIIVNQCSNVTGVIQPVEQIGSVCKKHNILFLVDGAQSSGVLNIDIKKIQADMFAFPGHKGLLGPQGTGGLYINENVRLKTLREGGTGSYSSDMQQPDDMPDKYESGTDNTPGIAGLGEGIKYVMKHRFDILKTERELTPMLINGLKEIHGIKIYGPLDTKNRLGTVTFNIGNLESGYVSDILDKKYDIATRAGLHCAPLVHSYYGTLNRGAVRASIGCFNTKNDIKKFLEAVNKISKENVK